MIGAISRRQLQWLACAALLRPTAAYRNPSFFISKPYMTRIGTYAAAEAERGGVAERFAASRYMSLR